MEIQIKYNNSKNKQQIRTLMRVKFIEINIQKYVGVKRALRF